MALIDRAIAGADVAVLHGSSLMDYASNASVTSSASLIDPMVSGCNYAHAFDGADGTKSMSIPIPSLAKYNSFCLEMYLHFGGTATQYTIASLGGTEFVRFIATGLVRITLPYLTPLNVFVPLTPEDTTQLSISMTRTGYSIWVDGVSVLTGQVPEMNFQSYTTVSFTSPNPAAGTVTVGAVLLYPDVQEAEAIQARILEAVFASPDAVAQYDFTHSEFSDFSQDFAVKFDIPKTIPWSDYALPGMKTNDGALTLDLTVEERWDEEIKSYVVSDLSRLSGPTAGLAHAYIPSYSVSASNRGIVHLSSRKTGFGQYGLRFTAGNRVEFLHTEFSTDLDGLDTSSTIATTIPLPATAIPAATAVGVGFGWNHTGLYVLYNGTAWFTGVSEFSPVDYQAVFGSERESPYGEYTNAYFASQAAWTWQIRLWDDFNELSPAILSTDYGRHTFFSSEVDTVAVPVRAQNSLVVSVPLPAGVAIRVPYLYVDSGNSGTVTEALE